tara:strand:- start:3952 stop:4218 length:267 start_codon:yes stop_codon:yes gene_type:complete
VKQLLQNIDSRELAEWAAYHSIEPIGGMRGDLQAGIVASTIANVNRGKDTKSFSPSDFMPIGKEAEDQTEDDMKSIMMKLVNKSNKAE